MSSTAARISPHQRSTSRNVMGVLAFGSAGGQPTPVAWSEARDVVTRPMFAPEHRAGTHARPRRPCFRTGRDNLPTDGRLHFMTGIRRRHPAPGFPTSYSLNLTQ